MTADETVTDAGPIASPIAGPANGSGALDLDAVETELADVEIALARLEAGTYWTCEVTGAPLPDDLLAANPTARRGSGPAIA